MAKSSSKAARAKYAKLVGGSKVLGTTKDGVRILAPKGKSAHFTLREAREAVASVMAARKA